MKQLRFGFVPAPWLPQPGEPPQMFDRFQAWLTGGRVYARVAEQCNVSEATIRQASARWNWKARAAAWDAEETSALRQTAGGALVAEALQQAVAASEQMVIHVEQLRRYRQRTEELGVRQQEVAIRALEAVVKTLDDLEANGGTIPITQLATIANAAANLAEKGRIAEGMALGVHELMGIMAPLMRENYED